MTRLRLGRSYWLDVFDGRAARHRPLHGRQSADVVVIGGGITGCAAAYLFARAGASVILVESERIGRGSTGASTALLMQEPDADFGDLAKRYSARTARRIWHCSRAAVGHLRRTLSALGAPDQRTLPSIYFTRDPRAAAGLRHEAALRRRANLPLRWLDAASTRRLVGFDAAGAILTPGNAQVDPYRTCLTLAAAAEDAGVRLHERSPITRIHGARGSVEVTLGGGRIDAAWAVIATGYAAPAFEPLAARFRMMNTYVIATPPLSASQRRHLGLGDVMLWDTERPYHYLRWTPDRRLLFGGRDRDHAAGGSRAAVLRRRTAELAADLGALFPALAGLRPEYAWEGLFANTPDGLPYIGRHRRYPRQLFALGYGGNGMTFGYLAAEALVRLARGEPSADDALFAFGRHR